MRNFKVGDEAIALSSASRPNQPRKKGRSYTVTSTQFCSTTGEQFVNIDSTDKFTPSEFFKCGCGLKHQAFGLAWTYSKHFVHPEDIDQRLADALEEEDYETASVLRDVKQERLV